MKIFHAAFMPGPGPGALQQMSWERSAASQAGLDWRVGIYTLPGVFPSAPIVSEHGRERPQGGLVQSMLYWRQVRVAFYRWLEQAARGCDALLLRHSTSNPWQAAFIRESAVPVFTVHHSSEEPELASQGGFASSVKLAAERIWGRASLHHAAGIVGLTGEILDYELSRAGDDAAGIVWPNGVLFEDDWRNALVDNRQGDTPEVLFVASHFFNWHGLDQLLAATASCEEDFRLHLVGNLDPQDRAVAEADDRIILHGHRDNAYIDELTARCWVGLSSFALDRKGMTEACTLKVRQYLKAGLPVYAGHRDVFEPEFPFYRFGPPEWQSILAYARGVRTTGRLEVAEAAYPGIAKDRLVKRLHDQLEALVAV